MSGTENLSAEVHAVVSKPQEESALQTLITSVANATEGPATNPKTNAIISKFVIIILSLTVTAFAMTYMSHAQHQNSSTAFHLACERAMAILASACPCSLGLATPSAVMAGLDAARLRGVIVSGGFETLRSLSKLTHLVLDKTGTLTTGRLSVSEYEGDFDTTDRILIAAAERDEAQTQPVARAVFKWAISSLSEEGRQQVNTVEVCKRGSSVLGGLTCDIQRPRCNTFSTLHIGNERFLLEQAIELPHLPTLLDNSGNQTFVHLAVDQKYAGSLRLNDTVRKEAPAVVDHLRNRLNLEILMLTGDIESEATRVSKSLHVPVLSSHALPKEKKAYVEDLQEQRSTNVVAMIGDGLNDSPALAAADVGICITLGLPRAVSETTNAQISNVVFTSPDLTRLPELLEIAAKTVRQSRLNIQWAIAYNVVAVTLAMGIAERYGVTVDAARAGTMMAFSSISVLAWSLCLRGDLSRVSFESIASDSRIK